MEETNRTLIMQHPLEILPQHKQEHENSCMAWGLDLILKMHGKLGVGESLFQKHDNKPESWGFGATERGVLKGYGIDASETFLDWKGFADLSLKEANRGSYPIFSLPLAAVIDLDRMEIGLAKHCFILCDQDGHLEVHTAKWKPAIIHRVKFPEKLFEMCCHLEPDCKVHVLTHG